MRGKVEEGKEITSFSELAKLKAPNEMLPKPLSKNMRKASRKELFEEHFRVVEECLKLDCTIAEACDYAGISVATYYAHYGKDPDFALRMDRARDFPKMMARTAVMKRIWQWDSKTALRYLELRDKKRYNTDLNVSDEEEEEKEESKVQFISIPANEWASNTTNHDSQTNTKLESVWPWYASSWGEKQTPWENEEEALRRLDSLNFSNG